MPQQWGEVILQEPGWRASSLSDVFMSHHPGRRTGGGGEEEEDGGNGGNGEMRGKTTVGVGHEEEGKE